MNTAGDFLKWAEVFGFTGGFFPTLYLQIANNLSDVANVATARTNLGLGTAALKTASNNSLFNVASVDGSTTIGHIATFADTLGTIEDGGAITQFLQAANNLSDLASVVTGRSNLGLGTAATQNTGFFLQTANNLSDVVAATARTNLGLGNAAIKTVSDNTQNTVASTKGAFTTGHIIKAADTGGTIEDGGAITQFLQTANNLSDVVAATARTNLGLGTAATHAVGDFLQTANNLSDVVAATARTNLGLGTAAVQNVAFFLQAANNLSDVTAATARTNLGLGTAAVQNVAFFLQAANNLSDLANASTARSNLSVPSATGVGASGTWGINISGNAATVTTNANLTGDVTSVGNAATLNLAALRWNPITNAGTTRTLALTDANADILFTNSLNSTLTIPTNASVAFPIGTQVKLTTQGLSGSNKLAVALAGGVTFLSYTLQLLNNGTAIIEKIGTDTWMPVYAYFTYAFNSSFTWGGFISGTIPISITQINNMVYVRLPLTSFSSTQTNSVVSNTALPIVPLSQTTQASEVYLSGTTFTAARFAIDPSTGLIYMQSQAGASFPSSTSLQFYETLFSFSLV